MGRTTKAISSSPIVVGAITVLVVVVGVFLAYNANSGLPFVPSYRVSVEVPNANTLVPGNEVRIGGVLVGQVERITPLQADDGSVSAQLDLKMNNDAVDLPSDTTVVIRAKSALGLKYVELVKGDSPDVLDEGSRLPLEAARPAPVELDELLATFDEPTRAAIKVNLIEFSSALAGRGNNLNSALGELRRVVTDLEPVARSLADPDTRFGRLFKALSAAAAEVAPVAEQQASAFVNLNITFTALAEVARPFIQETISRTPDTLDAITNSLPTVRPFLRNTAGFFSDLRPGARALSATAPDIQSALEAGIPVLAASPTLNDELAPTAASLRAFNDNAVVRTGIDELTKTSKKLTPSLRFIGPAQSVCNYAALLLRNLAQMQLLNDGLGNQSRAINLNPPAGPNNEGSPSSAPANGGGSETRNFLHYNPYPNTASPGQPRECEAGNEDYAVGKLSIGNVPGNQGVLTEEQGG